MSAPRCPQMTDEEIDAYNAEIEAGEARAAEKERRAEEMMSQCLLNNMVMPEDIAIQAIRGYTEGELLGFKKSEEAFVDDPVLRQRKRTEAMSGARWTVSQPPKRRRDEWRSTYEARCQAVQDEADRRNSSALLRVPGTPEVVCPGIRVPRGGL